jgi:hypothetical protein
MNMNSQLKTYGFRLWLVLFATTLGVCARAQEPQHDKDGFYEPRTTLLTHIKRVGIMPPRVLEFVGPRPEVKAHLEAQVTEKLTAAGFTVIGSQAYTNAYDEMNKKIGGIYSAQSGDLDRKKESAVRDHALRTFVESEKLDGLVDLNIMRVKASFYDNTTTWDSVSERTTGTPMSNNLIKAMWYAPSGTHGSLPALSLAMLIYDTNGKPLYISFGGIQMTAYRNAEVKESFSTFLDVPADQLLRDIPRIDRAIGIVTEPILLTPEQRKEKERAKSAAAQGTAHKKKGQAQAEPVVVLPPLPAGVVTKGEEVFKVPRDQILAQTKKVVLMPLLISSLPRDKENAVATRYQQNIAAMLDRVGITVVAPTKLLEAWRQEAGNITFYDPYTGEFDKERHLAVRRAAYARAKRDAPFDAVIWPSIVSRSAEYSSGTAAWDGNSQPLASADNTNGSWSSSSSYIGGSGSVRAISLAIKLHDTEDTELYGCVGGIQITERLTGTGTYSSSSKPEALTPSQLFGDPDRDRTATFLALRSLVFTPAELDELLHPKPAETDKKGKKKH